MAVGRSEAKGPLGVQENNLLPQKQRHQRRHEGEKKEDDHPATGFQASERFWSRTAIAAPPLARTPEVTVHVILVHSDCSKASQKVLHSHGIVGVMLPNPLLNKFAKLFSLP
jgi:hypothetical protein